MKAPSAVRLAKLRAHMEGQGYPAFLATSPENLRYLTGFRGGEGSVLVTSESQRLYVDFRYVEQAGQEAPGWDIVQLERNGDKQLMADIVSVTPEPRIAYESHVVSVSRFNRWRQAASGLKFVETERVIETIRAVKDATEAAALRAAASVADQALSEVLSLVREDMTERELALELDYGMGRRGAEKEAFETIVAFGTHSSLPHAIVGDRRLRKGDFVLIDFGAVADGYHSDMTRTFFLGDPTPEQRRIYEAVLHAQEESLRAVRPGAAASAVDGVAREVLAEYGLAEYFGHGLGHGIGLEIHEQPALSPSATSVLEEGMAVTIEPGVYIPGLGGVRIEDSTIVTGVGAERLTLTSKELTVI